MEEATLRAKIQAMKNLLAAKRHAGHASYNSGSTHTRTTSYLPQQPSRKYVRPTAGPATTVNRTWTRFPARASISMAAHAPGRAANMSVNKVWRREDAVKAGGTSAPSRSVGPASTGKMWKRSPKVSSSKPPRSTAIKRTNNSMQLQMLQLEDGAYKKANGGFSLVRANAKKPAPATATTAKSLPAATVSRTSNSVSIGGVKYVVANGGKVLKRCSVGEINKTVAATKCGSISLVTKAGIANAALSRAKAAMQRARLKRLKTASKGVKVRTEYCRFYNRFGFCKRKNDCKFIHDSRRVAMCRKFLRNECTDPNCLLSHQHDENKVPVCTLFLRGTCTREDCKYRHVKVSEDAGICEAFVKGYCSKGAACQLKHVLPQKKRKEVCAADSTLRNTSPSTSSTGKSVPSTSSPSARATNSAGDSSGSTSASTLPKPKDDTELSICPNIRFTPKHGAGFPSFLGGLPSKRPPSK